MPHWSVSAFFFWVRPAVTPPVLWPTLFSPKNCHPDGEWLHMGRSGHRAQLLCSFYGLAPPVSLLCPRPCPSAMPWWLCCISVFFVTFSRLLCFFLQLLPVLKRVYSFFAAIQALLRASAGLRLYAWRSLGGWRAAGASAWAQMQ